MRAALFVALAACQPSIAIEAVDVDAEHVVAQLVDDAKHDGSQVVRLDRPGVTVIVDSAAIAEHNVDFSSCAVGLELNGVITLAGVGDFVPCIGELVSAEVAISSAGQKLVLAHELGHAAGLADTTTGGLMTHGDHSCLHRETECLAAALAAR